MDRLAMHAALADPHRLAMVDLLALHDRSPGELSQALGLASNLTAHHLGVLEAAQIVTRNPSEGDARKSYVHLRTEHPIVAATVGPLGSLEASRVVFVCTHNSARSQFAASLFAQASSIPVASAGTKPATRIHPLALAVLEAQGLAPLADTPVSFADTTRDGDLVVAVCDNSYESLGPAHRPALHWSVPDPALAGKLKDFTAAFNSIAPRVQRLAGALSTGAPA